MRLRGACIAIPQYSHAQMNGIQSVGCQKLWKALIRRSAGSGHSPVGRACVLAVIWHCTVSVTAAATAVPLANSASVLKYVVAAIYANFRTHIVDDEGIEQEDGFISGPRGNQLTVAFEGVKFN